jgi:hypothetical protein
MPIFLVGEGRTTDPNLIVEIGILCVKPSWSTVRTPLHVKYSWDETPKVDHQGRTGALGSVLTVLRWVHWDHSSEIPAISRPGISLRMSGLSRKYCQRVSSPYIFILCVFDFVVLLYFLGILGKFCMYRKMLHSDGVMETAISLNV